MRTSDRGRIFDIRRFSTHDGGGIRTTVFFKGCPLKCAWCHNPEGISPERRPIWFSGSCMGCGSCMQAARAGGVRAGEEGILLNPKAEENWDAIMDACPTGALRWDSRDVSVEELMGEIRRDLPFYVHGGGGVTLSGGDPLMQPEFAHAVLTACADEGIHTALETELYARIEDVQTVLADASFIYADLKLMDDELHRRYTGAGNGRILDNFRWLLTSSLRDRVVVRIPMIPGVTATQENIASIARFLSGLYPDVRLELLNYNPLAAAKYPLVGREYCFCENPPRFSAAEMEAFRRIACEHGIKHILQD